MIRALQPVKHCMLCDVWEAAARDQEMIDSGSGFGAGAGVGGQGRGIIRGRTC